MKEIVGSDELKNAKIRECDLSGAQLRSVNFSNVTIADAWLFNTDISGAIGGLKINGVEVEPLIDAELDKRHPERTKLRATDVAGLRVAFETAEQFWDETIARARKLRPEQLHERVNGEYSFVETLRHLIFATDSWVTRIVLQVPNGHHEWGVAPDLEPNASPDTGPDLDAVLAVRAEKQKSIRDYLATATDAGLAKVMNAPDATAHPQGSFKVLECLRVVLNEEWWHKQYALRDLEILEGR
jgi:hypothetical protein